MAPGRYTRVNWTWCMVVITTAELWHKPGFTCRSPGTQPRTYALRDVFWNTTSTRRVAVSGIMPDLHLSPATRITNQADCLILIRQRWSFSQPLLACHDQGCHLPLTLVERIVAQLCGMILVLVDQVRADYKEIYPVWIHTWWLKITSY